jgi:2-oxoglutarate ferredoxin oxidoreductase subunit beta
MSYIAKPRISHPSIRKNKLGLTSRDYEGAVSTLCAGCGHDSVTAAIIQVVFDLDIEPHMLAKMSGIGCSSKTPAYFVQQSHGFNSVHGRMPSVTTGANTANRHLTYIGVSGDGDSLSIGVGQFVHAIRRNVNMCYIIENNGVYGLTKGQFSASADIGSKPKKPLIKGALLHKGFSLVDIISPCVTFNDHEGSTKSYAHTREFYNHVVDVDYIAPFEEITAEYEQGSSMPVVMHDGSKIMLRKIDADYDPTSRAGAFKYLRERFNAGEIVTGLLYIDDERKEMHDLMGNVDTPFAELPMESLRPPQGELEKILKRYR